MKPRLLLASFGFHEATDDPRSSGFQRLAALPFKQTVRGFREHLDAIAAGGVRPALVSAVDFARSGRYVLLTFDDGGKSALYASEELSRRGWRGHFCIVTSLIGGRTFLSAREIREIHRAGHAIGSHSHTHPDIFRDLTAERMAEEWRVSREILADIVGENSMMASVPGGDISPAVLRSAARAGIRYLFTSEPWLSPQEVEGCHILGRFGPKATTAPARIAELAQFRGWGRALFVRQVKDLARRTLPMLYRLYVRRTTRAWATP